MNDIVDTLRLGLEEALHHLYDPAYQPSPSLSRIFGCEPVTEPGCVQARVLHAIDALRPPDGTPPSNRRDRAYAILYHRFALGLPQDEVAELLHISLRTLQRAQREAIHALAIELWQATGMVEGAPASDGASPSTDEPGLDWHSQTEAELASLRASAPDRVADVSELLQGLLELERALTSNPDVRIDVRYVQPHLVAGVHPSALRQTVITAVSRLARRMDTGAIGVYAGLENGEVKITMAATLSADAELLKTAGDLTRDIVVPAGGELSTEADGSRVFVYIRTPSIGDALVLAVDDNPDMLHYYRRCVAGTRYRVIEATSGREALELVRQHRPDAIILDVMLPDVDGWKLLMQLHEDLQTRAIPVIVCTVVREETLARSLGAAHFLSKPVEPQELVAVLDQVLHPAPAAPQRGPASSPEAC